jgi:hypothetical protein
MSVESSTKRARAIKSGLEKSVPMGLRDSGLSTDVTIQLGIAYDAGFLDGSGQSSITALEREVIVAALEWVNSSDMIADDSKLMEAARLLANALEREATE